MIWLDILSWLAFGAIVGLWEVWFHRRHARFAEKTVIGMAGGLLGGALGKAVSGPADPVHIGRYDVLALVLAVAVAAIFVYVDVQVRRYQGRPSRRS
jgi:uncharacterized membrane protein YeaQ/YmgE (transglycosylase-associated protein family)